MARPSPRTMGVDAEGNTFPRFGTQQLTFVSPPKLGTPYQGVTQVDTGYNARLASQNLFRSLVTSKPNPFGTPVQRNYTIAPTVGVYTPPPSTATPNGEQTTESTCTTCDSDKCMECNAWDVGCELGHMMSGTCTPPVKEEVVSETAPTCTTCDSDKCIECNAWDVPCELAHMAAGTCTSPPKAPPFVGQSWWNKYAWVVYGVIAVAVIGILLWLLRPLFELLGIFKRGAV